MSGFDRDYQTTLMEQLLDAEPRRRLERFRTLYRDLLTYLTERIKEAIGVE